MTIQHRVRMRLRIRPTPDRHFLTHPERRHERAINAALAAMTGSQSRESRLTAWQSMTKLINQRSEHAVRVLEEARGLGRRAS